MAKDPKRVKAGKKAWAAMSQNKKNKILAALRRGRKSRSTGGGGGKKPASKPSGGGKTGNNRKPSWFTRIRAVIAMVIGLGGVIDAIDFSRFQPPGRKLAAFAVRASGNYSGYEPAIAGVGAGNFDANRLLRGYAPLAGGIAFYKGTGMLAKSVSRGLAAIA